MEDALYSALIPHGTQTIRDHVAAVLNRFGHKILYYTAERGINIMVLEQNQLYKDASPELARLAIDVDGWPISPAGLFVLAERTVYLRSTSSMTIAHEFGHALDCALGSNGQYFSMHDRAICDAFLSARQFVTPYAASRTDEYFAEAIRSYVECNDQASPWPQVSRARLQHLDPQMYGIVESIFAQFS